MSELFEREVYFVVNTKTLGRVSQYYIREHDAINKAKQINPYWSNEIKYAAVTGRVVDVKYCKGFEQEPNLIELDLP